MKKLKKEYLFFVVMVSCIILTFISLCIYGANLDTNTSSTQSSINLTLTSKMLQEIKNKLDSDEFINHVLRIESLGRDITFYKLNISTKEQDSPTTYKAYGKIYGKDKYGTSVLFNIDIIFTAEKNVQESKGYAINWDANLKYH